MQPKISTCLMCIGFVRYYSEPGDTQECDSKKGALEKKIETISTCSRFIASQKKFCDCPAKDEL